MVWQIHNLCTPANLRNSSDLPGRMWMMMIAVILLTIMSMRTMMITMKLSTISRLASARLISALRTPPAAAASSASQPGTWAMIWQEGCCLWLSHHSQVGLDTMSSPSIFCYPGTLLARPWSPLAGWLHSCPPSHPCQDRRGQCCAPLRRGGLLRACPPFC